MNNTMRLIGYQQAGQGSISEFDDIIRANMSRHNSIFAMVYDAFLLGIIYGKREERARRRGSRS